MNNNVIKKSTFMVLTSMFLLVGCQTTDKEVEKEIEKEVPVEEVEKEEKAENKPVEGKVETTIEIDKESQTEDIKEIINSAKKDILMLDNRKTTFNYSEYDKSDEISFVSESMIEKLVEMNVVKEALITNTNLSDGITDSFTVFFEDGKTYKKDSTGTVSTEANNDVESSEEFIIFTESLEQYIGFVHGALTNSEYNVEDVILEKGIDEHKVTFDAKDKTKNLMYHFEIKVDNENMLEKLTMTFDDNGKKVYTLDKKAINSIKHDFY